MVFLKILTGMMILQPWRQHRLSYILVTSLFQWDHHLIVVILIAIILINSSPFSLWLPFLHNCCILLTDMNGTWKQNELFCVVLMILVFKKWHHHQDLNGTNMKSTLCSSSICFYVCQWKYYNVLQRTFCLRKSKEKSTRVLNFMNNQALNF